ncbi:hypothetical protein J4206_06105 [Candidatus Woesearchaeota archaeon]|nr:hypothetical protein [Candidatus Woesearchaeota archaeon]
MDNLKKGYVLERDVIVIERELTDLDLFVKKFLDVLVRYSDYLVVSGFVSISTGRTRGTEDVDIIMPVISLDKFKKLFDSLNKDGFWCYQGDSAEDCYDYIKDLSSIRFALKDKMFPNIELIHFNATKKAKYFEFAHPQKIRINDFEFKIPPIEFEISYKEFVLAGKKDLEDAKHLRTFFADILKAEKFKEYLPIVKSELK